MPKLEQHQPEVQVGLRGKGSDLAPEWLERREGEREKVIDVLANWAEGGQGPGQRGWPSRLNRTYFRVRTDKGAIYEIAHELPQNRKAAARWVLIRQLQEESPTTAPAASASESVSKRQPRTPARAHPRAADRDAPAGDKPTQPKARAGSGTSAKKREPGPRVRKAGG